MSEFDDLSRVVNENNLLMRALRDNRKRDVADLWSRVQVLPPAQQAKILMQTTSDGWNAVMLAARYHPEAVEPLIALIAKLPSEDQAKILMQIKVDKWNAVILATYYNPKAVVPLLALIVKLPSEDQAKILMQTTGDGWNAVMAAACYHPEAVEPLLVLIAKLPPADQAKILMQTTGDGWNAVMFAAHKHPEVLGPLIAAVSRISREQKIQILEQSTEGYNVVMLAAYLSESEPLTILLRSIDSQSLQVKLLTRQSLTSDSPEFPIGNNALHLALQAGETDNAALILNTVNQWEKSDQTLVLTQINKDKNNALMLAAANPEILPLLLNTMATLPVDTIEAIFGQKNAKGQSALRIVLTERPENLPQMLAFINKLPKSSQAKILQGFGGEIYGNLITHALNSHLDSQLDEVQKQVLQTSPETLVELYDSKVLFTLADTAVSASQKRFILELQMATHLAVLHAKMQPLRDEKKDTEDPASPYNTAKKLADTLDASWVAYQSGASGESAEKLAADFTQSIETARPVLSRLDDGAGILNMLLRFVKDMVKFLLPVKLETGSEKVFTNLDEKMASYKPIRASRDLFFKGKEVSIPEESPPAYEQASSETEPSAPAHEGSPRPEPSAPSLDEDENEPGLQSRS